MLVNLLDQSITEMKEIYELEKSSNDVQKQEKNDRMYSEAVSESLLIVEAVSNGMSQLNFSVSPATKNRVTELLKSLNEATARGMVQEAAVKYIQKEISAVSKSILQEWSEHYHRIADQKVNMLRTINGIAADRDKVYYASNKIKMGESWEFKQDRLDMMKKGLQEADEIINNLGFGGDDYQIIEFLKKVADGRASVHDLTPTVFNWLNDKNLTTKLMVSFK